jgi:hypothetical protein
MQKLWRKLWAFRQQAAVATFQVPLSLQPPHYAYGFVAVAAFGALHIANAFFAELKWKSVLKFIA